MKFKPISEREDASGGIVFRFDDGKYYVVRANWQGESHGISHFPAVLPPLDVEGHVAAAHRKPSPGWSVSEKAYVAFAHMEI